MRTLGLVALAFLLCGCPKHDPFAVGKSWNMVSDLPGNPVTKFQIGALTANKSYCVFGTPIPNVNNSMVDLYITKTDARTYINAGAAINAHVYLYKDPVQGPVIFEVLLTDMNSGAILDTVFYGRNTANPQLPDRLLGAAGTESDSAEAQLVVPGYTEDCPSNAAIVTAHPWGATKWISKWSTSGSQLLAQFCEDNCTATPPCFVESWWFSADYLEKLTDFRVPGADTSTCTLTPRFTLTRVK